MDRHRKGYYAEYNRKRKEKGLSTDRHRKGYYKEYNMKHPERLERIGIHFDEDEDEDDEFGFLNDCYNWIDESDVDYL